MLDTNLKQTLKTYLQNLKTQVELVVSLDDSAKANEVNTLATEIAELSDLVSLRRDDSASKRAPAMTVRSVANNTAITFAGVPLGHEFTSLVLALLHSGGHPIKVEAALIEQIRNISGSFSFETYVSLSCQTCPEVVQALNIMSAINPNITNVMIDGAIFQDEVAAKNIMAVPSVYLNGELFSQGAITIEKILQKIDVNAEKRQAEALKNKADFDVLVVGGGPAGSAAAIYSARKGLNTGIVAERFGGQVADTVGIENFISVKYTEGPKLVAGLESHVREYNVDIMNNQRAVKLSKGDKVELELQNGAVLKSKTLILSPGARWREMNVPGEQEYRGRGVAYCPHCDGPLFKGKRVAVIGGGNSGVEAAIDLAGIVAQVTLIEFDSQLRADAVLQKKLHSLPNVTVITSALTSEVTGDGKKVTGLTYKDRNSSEFHELELEGIFVQIGLLPNSDWLKGTVELTSRGEIIVDARGETSLPGIFAAGDVTTVPYKQIVIAVGEGAKASLSAFDHLIRSSVED